MGVPSLAQLTRRALIKNISMLTDIGDIPYDIIRPVLLKIENPKQLQMLEEVSPQIYGADEEIWISFIKRDIPNGASKMMYPKNPKLWWKVYRKMRQDYEDIVQDDAAKLKAAFTSLQAAKDSRQIRMMEGTPKLPKLDGMQYAHAMPYNKIKKPPKIVKPVMSVIKYANGSKTKVLTGKGFMDKARREAQDMSRFSKTNVMATPTHMLSGLATFGQPAAPQWSFMNPVRYNRPPPSKPIEFVHGAKKPRAGSKAAERIASAKKLEDRERRLRALANPIGAARAPVTTLSSTASIIPGSSAKLSSTTITTFSMATSAMTGSSAKRTPTKTTTPSPTSSAASRRSAEDLATFSSATMSHSKPTPSSNLGTKPINNTAPCANSSPSKPAGLKRKAEDTPMPSVEADGSGSTRSQAQATPSPPHYKIPRLSRSPSTPAVRPPKRKAPVNIFMPQKRRIF